MRLLKILSLVSILTFFACVVHAKEGSSSANLSKFATIKASQVNARVGPGLQYPVCLLYTNKGEPVEIISEFNHWRQIKDFDGEKSWVHVSLLSRNRAIIVNSLKPVNLYAKPVYGAKVVGIVQPKVRCDFLNYCSQDFCKVKCAKYKGWLMRKDLWGIAPAEFSHTNKLLLYFKSLW